MIWYTSDCEAVISVDEAREGATVTCRECGTKLEIISTNPFEVDFPLDYDEDWSDDDWEQE